MEQPRSPPMQIMEPIHSAANKEIQTPEPGAWLGKDIGFKEADVYPELQIKDIDAPAPEAEREMRVSEVHKQKSEDHHHSQGSSLGEKQDETDDSGHVLAEDLGHTPHGSAFADSGIDLNHDAHELSPEDTPESGSAFQSTQTTPIASSDNLIKHELESQRMMLPDNNASDDQTDTQALSQISINGVVHDPMADLLWGRVSHAPEAPMIQRSSSTELLIEHLDDPMADILWGRSSSSIDAPRSVENAQPSNQNFTQNAIYDPMGDILWERVRTPASDAPIAAKHRQAAVTALPEDFADPMSDYLWGRRQIPRSHTMQSVKGKSMSSKEISREIIHDPMFDVLWGRIQASQSNAVSRVQVEQTPVQELSAKVIYDPMSDYLWGRKEISHAPEARKSNHAQGPDQSEVISDPMSDFLWGRNQKSLSNLQQPTEIQQTPTSKIFSHDPMADILWGRSQTSQPSPLELPMNQQKPITMEQRHDPMADLLWGRSQASQSVLPDVPKKQQPSVARSIRPDPMFDILWERSEVSRSVLPDVARKQQAPVAKSVRPDAMFDILWERSEVSQSRYLAAPQDQETPGAVNQVYDPMSDVLWGRSPASQPSVYEDRDVENSPSYTNADLTSKILEHQRIPVTDLSRDPMFDVLWGRDNTSLEPANVQGERTTREATELGRTQVGGFAESTTEDVARNPQVISPLTGSWPLATGGDLIIDHSEDNLSMTSAEEIQSIVGQATPSQLADNEIRHLPLPFAASDHLNPHGSVQNVEERQCPPTRHHDGEPWPLRGANPHESSSNGLFHDQDHHDASDELSDDSDNWSESDEDEGSEPEQRFGSLRPHHVHRMTNDDEYLPRSAKTVAAIDSEEDLSFEEKYGVPRPTSAIRSLSKIDNDSDSPHTGPDVDHLFDDDSEDDLVEHSQRDTYPEDLADQYFQRADTPLEVVPEHAPLTEFNDTYAAHRSSGLFANIVDAVRSDIPAVREVQLDNHHPAVEYQLGNATRPRAVSFEDDEPEYAQASASTYEPSLHVRTHTADTVPSFDSYAHSDSLPTTPSETSSSPFMDHIHDEPVIRDSGRERGMTETSQTAQDLALETPKAAAFDPSLTTAYPSFISPKPSYANLRDNHQDAAEIERMNAGYGSFGAQTGLEAHRAELSPIRNADRNPFTNGVDTLQAAKMASNNPFKSSPVNLNSPGSVYNRTPTAENSFRTTRSLPRTPPRLSISPQSSAPPAGINGSSSPSPGLSKRPPPPVPTGSPGSLFAKTRSVFESASPQGSPALTPSPITALSAIRHNSPPLPPPPRRSVGSRPSSLYISEPVQYSPPAEKEREQANGQEQQEDLEEEAFMPRSLDGNNKPPSPVFIPSRSGSISSLRKEDDDLSIKKRSSNPFLGGLSRFVGGIQSGGLDDSMHNPAREPLLKRGEEH